MEQIAGVLNEPEQPAESEWRFVQELQAPLWTDHGWSTRSPNANEACLAIGVCLRRSFVDSNNVLETSYADLKNFLGVAGVRLDEWSTPDGDIGEYYVIETRSTPTDVPESFTVEVTPTTCTISAGDAEGVRRGIFHIEDEMRRAQGPYLPLGSVTRTPAIRTRISRCFFGPIKRPPKNRDELADDVDYYPAEYLNRLAHDGVNALWLSLKFREVCRSRSFPDHGADAERRLGKLRRTVQQCARYGIKIYAFCIEPMAFGNYPESMLPWSDLERNSEFAGHHNHQDNFTCFCTSSKAGQEYLEESAYALFDAVPGLGGLIDINLGERATHCYSSPRSFTDNNCPRCSLRDPGDVFADTLRALARGMQRANPSAELVSWLYIPYLVDSPESDPDAEKARIRHIAASVPENVTLQVNFESLGTVEQHGREHTVLDYSLAHIGPSELFRDCAVAARAQGARVSAKLQVGCSHEVATVPFVPVPGNLYRKYSRMHELGVSTAMQCWYFGNYPSMMNKAAGLLSFSPLPATEDEFLHQLASIDWGGDAPIVVRAWQKFREAYSLFPAALQFSWFGPVHDCITWPLHLFPVDQIIAPSWLLGFAPSGDRIAECFAYEFSLNEIQATCREMAEIWRAGLECLEVLEPRATPHQSQDIGVARALGLQFQSASNVISFYAIREALFDAPQDKQAEYLAELRGIVAEEIANSRRLAELARVDSRLGFHSEAEGYKYFPEKLEWRANSLQKILNEDFPLVESRIHNGQLLCPEYSGQEPEGPCYRCPQILEPGNSANSLIWNEQEREACLQYEPVDARQEIHSWATSWQALSDTNNLYLRVSCCAPGPTGSDRSTRDFYGSDHVAVRIEPRRLWPSQLFCISRDGRTYSENKSTIPDANWEAIVEEIDFGWQATFIIPWSSFSDDYTRSRPVRINIERKIPGIGSLCWIRCQPLPPRLIFESDNPADYGWLLFH